MRDKKRERHREKEKAQSLERSLDFLHVVYLFIYFCRIPSFFPRSEVKLRNVFPPNKEKTKLTQFM